MSDSMVGEIHASRAGDLIEQNVRGVAEAIALVVAEMPHIKTDIIDLVA